MKRIPEPSVAVLIPSYNNFELLTNTLVTLKGTSPFNLLRVYVLNNGHPDLVKHMHIEPKDGVIIQMPENVGWERALDYGVKHTTEPFVMFLNDDVHFLPTGNSWFQNMFGMFGDPTVGAVGPMSNIVLGQQNLFQGDWTYEYKVVKFLIGFCMLIRREALDKAGGVDVTCPGGDDLDLSIRLRQAGYKLLVARNAYLHHHAFQTGTRVHGAYWNGEEMQDKTNNWLIHKHGLKTFLDTMRMTAELYDPVREIGGVVEEGDMEGMTCLPFIQENPVVEFGCGNKKTVDQAIGVDMVKGNDPVPQLQGLKSVADVQADVEGELPFAAGSVGTIVARHILEHCLDVVGTLQAWSQLLTPTGHLVIAVPDHRIRNTIPLNPEHVHAFTPESLQRLGDAIGLECVGWKDGYNTMSFVMTFRRKATPTERPTTQFEYAVTNGS